jgi:large subunit ribosomal protein L28
MFQSSEFLVYTRHSGHQWARWQRQASEKMRYYLPSERRWVRLTLSARGIRTIDRIGIESAIVRIRTNGHRV